MGFTGLPSPVIVHIKQLGYLFFSHLAKLLPGDHAVFLSCRVRLMRLSPFAVLLVVSQPNGVQMNSLLRADRACLHHRWAFGRSALIYTPSEELRASPPDSQLSCQVGQAMDMQLVDWSKALLDLK